MQYTERDIALFWLKVERKGESDCWPWLGACTLQGGYGLFDRRRNGERLAVRAHRFSYALLVGPAPPLLRHTCDNPPCVNPKHLLPGTPKDNSQDMVLRGRHWTHQRPEDVPRGNDHWTAKKGVASVPRGQEHPNAKLTSIDVKKIRNAYSKGKTTQRTLAVMFRVSQGTIWQIVNGRYWRSQC